MFSVSFSLCLLALLFFSETDAFFQSQPQICNSKTIVRKKNYPKNFASTAAVSPVAPIKKMKKYVLPTVKANVSRYKVGQQLTGKVVNVARFGIFVEVSPNLNALLPRSELSSSQYAQLSNLSRNDTQALVTVELINVSKENGTITAKYISGLPSINRDAPRKTGDNLHHLATKRESTVSKHGSHELSQLALLPKDQWLTASVQSVTKFGLLVRPAGFVATGLVSRARIPRELQRILKARITAEIAFEIQEEQQLKMRNVKQTQTSHNESSLSKSGSKAGLVNPDLEAAKYAVEFENLFTHGDVVKVRIKEIDEEQNKLELSMIPEEQEDDNMVSDFSQTKLTSESGNLRKGRSSKGQFDSYEDDLGEIEDTSDDSFDPESVLLWWYGSPYERFRSIMEYQTELNMDEMDRVCGESPEMVVGQWRRRFEEDLRQDSIDTSLRELRQEMLEIEEEIGEMAHATDELQFDPLGLGLPVDQLKRQTSNNPREFGFSMFTPQELKNLLPEEMTNQLTFFDKKESEIDEQLKLLKRGKRFDEAELRSLMTELEEELQSMTSRSRKN